MVRLALVFPVDAWFERLRRATVAGAELAVIKC
jgi:hypothetical protein